eukprot:8389004-Pyramimonas_sp.AAC.1
MTVSSPDRRVGIFYSASGRCFTFAHFRLLSPCRYIRKRKMELDEALLEASQEGPSQSGSPEHVEL